MRICKDKTYLRTYGVKMNKTISFTLMVIITCVSIFGCPKTTRKGIRKPAFTGAGRNLTMTLDTNGNPHIVYADDSNLSYNYAYHDEHGWHIETVDVLYIGEKREDTLYFIPNSATLVVDSNSTVYLLYSNPYKRTIEYRIRGENGWSGNTIDSVENYGGYAGDSLVDGKGQFLISSLNIGSNGIPWIHYQYLSDADFYNAEGIPLVTCFSGSSTHAALNRESNIWEKDTISIPDVSAYSFALIDNVPTIIYIQDGIVKYGEWISNSFVDRGILYEGNHNASCAYIVKKREPFMVILNPDGYIFGKKAGTAWQFESRNLPEKIVGDYSRSAITDIDKYYDSYYFGAEFYLVDVIRELGNIWYSNTYLGIIKNDKETWEHIWLYEQPYGNEPSIAIDQNGKIHIVFNYVEQINHPKNEPYEFHAKLYYGVYDRNGWQIELVDE